MNLRASFHYLLAFAVLFASSFAVFHSSEHINMAEKNAFADAYDVSPTFHSDKDHSLEIKSASEQAVENVCEACLLVLSLSAPIVNSYSSYLALKENATFSSNQLIAVASLQKAYLSRAPPYKA